jgi:hypothetical protein
MLLIEETWRDILITVAMYLIINLAKLQSQNIGR